MTSFITKAALAPVAASLALVLGASLPAAAQAPAPQYLTNGPTGAAPNVLPSRARTSRPYQGQPLTVRRPVAAPVVVAAPVAAPVVANPITGVLGVGSTVVGLPFQVLGGIFPGSNTPLKGGVTAVRYEGTRDQVAAIDEGWATPVPVDHSGPIYVVENGDKNVSPLVFVAAQIRAVGTIAQTPFRVIGAPFGGTTGTGLVPGLPGGPVF